MIPGPVNPSVASEAGLRPSPKAGVEPGPDGDGRSFEDLLAAMLAPGAAPAAEADAAAPETAGAVFERLDAAEIFNETGLFRGAAPLSAEGVATRVEANAPRRAAPPEISAEAALQLALSPSTGTAPASPETPTGAQQTAARQAELSGGAVPTSASTRAASRASMSLRGQPASLPQQPARSVAAERMAASAARRPQAAAMLVQAWLAKGGSTSAQVTVQAVEGGISLVARADRLSREERDRLRAEIGELLARHGLAATGIVLNGEAWPAPEGGKD